jgi:hypothetical protein
MNIRELVHFLQIVLITHYFICKRDNDERKCGLQKKKGSIYNVLIWVFLWYIQVIRYISNLRYILNDSHLFKKDKKVKW